MLTIRADIFKVFVRTTQTRMSIRELVGDMVWEAAGEDDGRLFEDVIPSRDFCKSCRANSGCLLADLRIDELIAKGILVLPATFMKNPPGSVSSTYHIW